MNSNAESCYKNLPLANEDGIPVFSKTDSYIENYDRISEDHLKHYNATGHNPFMQEDHWEQIEKSTEELINKYATEAGTKILDIGVGMGRLLERFPNFSRFGIDISHGYLKHAKNKGIEVCMSRIEDMPYKERYFDVVATTDVLEHVLDLNLAISKILNVVKEEGIIVIRVPYKEDLKKYLHPDFPYRLAHLRNFDEDSLRILFEKIFNIQVLEWNLTGYRGGIFRVGANFKYYAGILRRLLNLVGKLNHNICDYMAQRLCYPSEINMVIRNSKKNSCEP
jgi:ubiquinone/menaquinone biosynthesis C-methylase UbiE